MAPLDGSKSTHPGPGTWTCTQAWVLPPVRLSSSSATRRYPETKRAAKPSERSAAIISTARSRQLPLARCNVSAGLWIPFSCRATCLQVRLMVRVMSTRSSPVSVGPSSATKPAAQRSTAGCGPIGDRERSERRPVLRGVGEGEGPGEFRDLAPVEAGRRVVHADRAREGQLLGAIGERRHRQMIAEGIARPRQAARTGRDLDRGIEDALVPVVARAEHHHVLAERHRPPVAVGRQVSDRENRHGRPAPVQVQ